MAALSVYLVRLTLPPGVFAAFEEELRASDLSAGLFCLGTDPIDPMKAFMFWHHGGARRVILIVPLTAFANAEGARIVARDFLAKWQGR